MNKVQKEIEKKHTLKQFSKADIDVPISIQALEQQIQKRTLSEWRAKGRLKYEKSSIRTQTSGIDMNFNRFYKDKDHDAINENLSDDSDECHDNNHEIYIRKLDHLKGQIRDYYLKYQYMYKNQITEKTEENLSTGMNGENFQDD